MIPSRLSPERLEEVLQALPDAHIGVLGDFCLDVYWMLDLGAAEVSVETGKMTRPVRRQRYSLGGAGNVVANLCALGVGRVSAFGVVGADPFGVALVSLLQSIGVDCAAMLTANDESVWQTLTYCKPYVEDEEQPRLDMGNFNALPTQVAVQLIDALHGHLSELDVVVVNQQVANGIHTEELQTRLARLMASHTDRAFLFDGRHICDVYPNAWLKLNDTEAVSLVDAARDPDDLVVKTDAEEAAHALFSKRGQPVFVTRGSRGCIVCDQHGLHGIPGLQVIGPTDTVGAGDSFLAGLAAATAVGANHAESAELGNVAARVTVTKLRQTGTATPDEIRAVGRQPHYVYRPEIADDPRQASCIPGTQIEVLDPIPEPFALTHAIFDHDGTLSTLRQGWEEVMEPMMIRAILGDSFDHADETTYHKVARRVRQFIDQTTGVQTLVQMQGLRDMVAEFGHVPADEIRNIHCYKAVYDRALMQRVNERIARLQSGELNTADFTVKGAVAFVRKLLDADVTCFLASGTDENDVRNEADAMGYAHLFKGGIYGAVGDLTREAKRDVIQRILRETGQRPECLATFGDGPVEIRETRLTGGYAIGVASDELRRFDLNPAKRARLIRAGAQAVIPDFSQPRAILDFLRIGESSRGSRNTAPI